MELNTILKFNPDLDTIINSQPELNTIETVVTPEKPKVLANEQIEVYIPKADYNMPGVASFDSEGFVIDPNGKVRLRRTSLRNVKDFIVDVETGICTIYYDDGTISTISFPVSTDKIYKRNELLRYVELKPHSFIKDHNTGQWFAILPHTLTGFTNSNFMVSFEVKVDQLDVEGITDISNQGYVTVMDSVYKGNDGSVLIFIDTDLDRYNFYGRLLLLGGSIFVDGQIVSMNYNTATGKFSFTKTGGGYYEFNLLPMSELTDTLIDLDNKVDTLEASRVNVTPEDWECIYEDGTRETKTMALIDKLGAIFKSDGEGPSQAKEIVTVDVIEMLSSQNTYLFLDLTKRFNRGEILILGNLRGSVGLIEASTYKEDADGNPIKADWVLTTSEWSNDEDLSNLSSSILSVHILSYSDGYIEYGYTKYNLYHDFVRKGALSDTLDTAKKFAKDNFVAIPTTEEEKSAACETIGAVKAIKPAEKNVYYFPALSVNSDGTVSYWSIKGTPEPSGEKVVIRSKQGRAQIQDPVEPMDIANRQFVEETVANAGGGGGGTKLYKHLVTEDMDTSDPDAPKRTHTLYSFRDTPYTSRNDIIADFNKGVITSFYSGYSEGKLLAFDGSACIILLGPNVEVDHMTLVGSITNDVVTVAWGE